MIDDALKERAQAYELTAEHFRELIPEDRTGEAYTAAVTFYAVSLALYEVVRALKDAA